MFSGKISININELGFSQIYLSSKKIENVNKWFNKSLNNFEPIPVRDFKGNGKLILTDGHTRSYIAWKSGIEEVPAIYDKDEKLVTNEISNEMYLNCIRWCERLKILRIEDFSERILDENRYKELWINRCLKMQNLVLYLKNNKTKNNIINETIEELKFMDIYVYGISENLNTLFCENSFGELLEIENRSR